MQGSGQAPTVAAPDRAQAVPPPSYERFVDTGRQGMLRRVDVTLHHLYALLVGALVAYLRSLPEAKRRQPHVLLLRLVAAAAGLVVSTRLFDLPFPVQLRRRLELLGPTYIKLGQILSLREDLLPRSITDELKHLLDQLPAIPYARFVELVARELGRPVDEVFREIREAPLGSASIGQVHLATLLSGEQVILKVVKPGIRDTLRRDTTLLRALGVVLELFLARFQPRRMIREFCDYTMREVDLVREADNAETFAANFRDQPDIVFPRIFRAYSNENMLCMEFLDGIKPGEPRSRVLRQEDRERLIDLGAESIICMLYRDGFFHADLHPGNLLILPGPKVGFVDLGMVGRFDTELKRTLLYYYYSLVVGDAENAAHYLAALARPGRGSDVKAFRRDVEDVCRQWAQRSRFGGFSMGRLILQSVGRGARHRMYFPVELVLMSKAIVTFEAVGEMLLPGVDVATVTRKHVSRVTLQRFAPLRLARESLTALPELIDALGKTPRLLTEGLRLVEQASRQPTESPFSGLRATLFGGACLVAGAILAGLDGPWPIWVALFVIGILLPLRRK
jgi:ubiquinone biosynthesis protein